MIRFAATLLAMSFAAACTPGRDSGTTGYDFGPGQEAWGDDDISCETAADCMTGEICSDNLCQPERCQGAYNSASPIGENYAFFQDNEVGIVDTVPYEGDYWVDGYSTGQTTLSYDYSWSGGGQPITDIAGGAFHGVSDEVYAVSFESRTEVGLLYSSGTTYIDTEIVPLALSAGDTDGDGIDQIVAVNNSWVAICDATEDSCEYWEFIEPIQVVDLAVGDVDGDNFEEPVILVEYEGYDYLYVINPDAEETGQSEFYSGYVGEEGPGRIAVADVNGDRIGEIVGLVDGGYWGWFSDGIVVYVATEGAEGGEVNLLVEQELSKVDAELVDVAAADTDLDDLAEVVVLHEDGEITSLGWDKIGFEERFTIPAGITASPNRIAMADHDGDTPTAKLVDGPIDVAGDIVPVTVLIAPPYNSKYSDGTSNVFFGNGDAQTESITDTVSMGSSVDIGFGVKLFDAFGGEAGAKLSVDVSESTGTQKWMFFGGRYSLDAEPEKWGPNYGAVVMSWACFHGYVYEIDDPNRRLDDQAHGEQFVMTVPVDGATSTWSTHRYNALAEALGTLPVIEIPHSMGQPETYNTEMLDLEGNPVEEEAKIFPDADRVVVSDISPIRFWNSRTDGKTYSESYSITMGAYANVKVAGVKVGSSADIGWGQSYNLWVGEQLSFAGTIPTLPDDPDTPEDEYAENVYGVAPYVYLEEWGDPENPAYFYVANYILHDD